PRRAAGPAAGWRRTACRAAGSPPAGRAAAAAVPSSPGSRWAWPWSFPMWYRSACPGEPLFVVTPFMGSWLVVPDPINGVTTNRTPLDPRLIPQRPAGVVQEDPLQVRLLRLQVDRLQPQVVERRHHPQQGRLDLAALQLHAAVALAEADAGQLL